MDRKKSSAKESLRTMHLADNSILLAVRAEDLKLCKSCGLLCCLPSRIKKHENFISGSRSEQPKNRESQQSDHCEPQQSKRHESQQSKHCEPQQSKHREPRQSNHRESQQSNLRYERSMTERTSERRSLESKTMGRPSVSSAVRTTPAPSKQRVNRPAQLSIQPSSHYREAEDNRVACAVCQRFFAPDRVDKHESMCARVEDYTDRLRKRSKPPPRERSSPAKVLSRKPDWRRKHEEFIKAIRAAREMQVHVAGGGKLSDLPPAPPLDTSDYKQCPHCMRRFNHGAAERHIPFCKTQHKVMPKSVSCSGGATARLKNRPQSARKR